MADAPLDPAQVLANLEHALRSRDAEAIEEAVVSAFQVGLCADFVPALVALLRAEEHHKHEDIVRALQQLKDPRAVDALYEAAFIQHAYLEHDELFGLARKCTWALADIGTPEAVARLRSLASSDNALVATYARKRIDAWDNERGRKGHGVVG